MNGLNAAVQRDRGIAIAVAPNGGRRTKADHPALPISPAELAECAEACLAAGASMIHVHVRNGEGRHSLDVLGYQAAIEAIRTRVSNRLIIQVTTEALGLYTPADQIELVRMLRPEACSIALREIVPDASHEVDFAVLLDWMRRERIIPQIILYDRVDLGRLEDMHKRGLIPSQNIPVLFVLGRYSAHQQSSPSDLLEFLAAPIVPFAHWSVCAFGRDEAACAVSAALMGGDIRLGFENNLFLPDGTVAANNAALLAPVSETLRLLGREIKTAEMQRAALETIW